MENPVNPAPEPAPQPAIEAAALAVPADPGEAALGSESVKGISWFYWIGGLSIVNIGMGFIDHIHGYAGYSIFKGYRALKQIAAGAAA